MDWTTDNQIQLEDYVKTYLGQLTDISKFFTNMDLEKVIKTTHFNDVEFIKLKVDELFDHMVMDNDLHLSKFVSRWGNRDSPLFREVSKMINSIGLVPFREVVQETSANVETQLPTPGVEARQKAYDMPELTKNQRRLSLELMQSKPKFPTTGNEGQLATTAATSITNLNVTTRSKPVLDRTFNGVRASTTKPELRNRRTSIVGEQLPKYIREQLNQEQPVQKITPKTSVRKLLQNNLPTISDTREVSRKPSRLQNLVTTSQSLYAHSNDVNSTTNTSEVENQLRYDTDDDDDREYILPGLLAKYYGVQFEDGSDVDYDDDEEDVDFVNVGGSISNDDENDYLFKV